MLGTLNEWFEIAKYIGAGATFVLGIVCWNLWLAYKEELKYSKSRDRETLTVLSAIVDADKTNLNAHNQSELKILHAIQELKAIIIEHKTK